MDTQGESLHTIHCFTTEPSASALTSTENLLDTGGEIFDKAYNMGCHDHFGSPLNDTMPVGQRRNRTFDRAVSSSFTEP